jgi:hypothetical protein
MKYTLTALAHLHLCAGWLWIVGLALNILSMFLLAECSWFVALSQFGMLIIEEFYEFLYGV